MNMPTSDQINSFLRHVYSATAAATSMLVIVGLSQGDATALGTAIHQIGDGAAKMIAGITALIPVIAGLYAAWSASPLAKLMSMQKNPEIKQVVAVPGTATGALAESIPGNKITTAAKVVVLFLAAALACGIGPKAAIAANFVPLLPLPKASSAGAAPSATTVAQNILATAPADLNYAILLATQINTPASNVRKQCYQAILAAIPTAPTGSTPPPGPEVVTHIEQAAELADTLNPSSPVFVNCAGAATLVGQNVLSFINAIVTGVAGIAILAPKL